MRLWSTLQPWEWRAELAKVHADLTEDCLIAEGRTVPELRAQIDVQESREDKVRVVLRFFGDERHPQPDPVTPARYGPAIDGGPPAMQCPRWERLAPLDGAKPGAKELGIPERETFWIIERRLENSDTHSREWLAKETKRRTDLEYVPRTRLTPLVDWIDLHREAAERAARLREIPSEFRAGELGPIPPGS